MLRVPVSKRGMAHFIHDVFPIITAAAAFLSTIVTVVITLSRARIEHRNLRRIDVKDRLDLLDEVEKRLDQDSLHAWRYKNAEPPKGSIEDQLAKDLLVSHSLADPSLGWSGLPSGGSSRSRTRSALICYGLPGLIETRRSFWSAFG